MKINQRSWHFLAYKAGLAMWCRFTGNEKWEYLNYVNLCTYIRVITVYFPIMVGIHLAVYLSPWWVSIWVASNYPTTGISSAWSAVMMSIFGIFALLGIILGFLYFMENILPGAFQKVSKIHENRREKALRLKGDQEEEKEPELSTWQIFVQWLNDRHEKICRKINFSGKEKRKMEQIRKFNPLLTFKGFIISAVMIMLVSLIMHLGAKTRYDTITIDVIGSAERVNCPTTMNINRDDRRVEYTAQCPWGKMKGILDPFYYIISPPEQMSCYSTEYAGDTFQECNVLE